MFRPPLQKGLVAVLSLFVFWAGSPDGLSEEITPQTDGPRAVAPRTVTVVTEIWPPFRIPDPKHPDRFTGIDIDLLNALAERFQWTLRVKRLPWARCLAFMRTGEADMITGLAHTPERAEYIHYSRIPYYTVAPAFYTTKGSGGRIATYEDLRDFKIGYSIDSAYFEPFNSDATLKKTGVSTEHQLLQMLAGGRLDIIIGTDCNLEYDIARMGLKGAFEKTVYRPDKTIDLYVGISKNSPLAERLADVNDAIAEMVRSGEVERMARPYF